MKCKCQVEDGVQVTWCIEHNGWAYARSLDKLRQNLDRLRQNIEIDIKNSGLTKEFAEIAENMAKRYGEKLNEM